MELTFNFKSLDFQGMKKSMKTVLCLVLSLIMAFSSFSIVPFMTEANAVVTGGNITNGNVSGGNITPGNIEVHHHKYVDGVCSVCGVYDIMHPGICGENLTWTLDIYGTLTISGTGDMYDCMNSGGAWGPAWSSPNLRIPGNMNADIDIVKKVVIKDGVTSIGKNVFARGINITEIEIPDSVKKINAYAFAGCSSLESINISASVTEIGCGAFSGCSFLTEIIVDEGNQYFVYENGILFDKNKTTIVSVPVVNSDAIFEVPAGVATIGDGAFRACDELFGISVPKSVTSIGTEAFYACENLTDVYYGGTEAQWNAIIIGSGNEALLNATIHFNYVPEEEYDCELNGHKYVDGVCFECGAVLTNILYESEHPYSNNFYGSWQLPAYSNAVSLEITFSDETCTEDGYDFIEIYSTDEYGNPQMLVGRWSGSDLAGRTITVIGNGAIIYLTTDHSITDYGFAVVNVTYYYLDEPTVTKGDVNGDGKVTSDDARRVLRAAVALETFTQTQFLAADMIEDEKITAADAREILRIVCNNENNLIPEYKPGYVTDGNIIGIDVSQNGELYFVKNNPDATYWYSNGEIIVTYDPTLVTFDSFSPSDPNVVYFVNSKESGKVVIAFAYSDYTELIGTMKFYPNNNISDGNISSDVLPDGAYFTASGNVMTSWGAALCNGEYTVRTHTHSYSSHWLNGGPTCTSGDYLYYYCSCGDNWMDWYDETDCYDENGDYYCDGCGDFLLQLGDLNLDGRTNSADARLLLRYLVGIEELGSDVQKYIADIFYDYNNVGVIDSADAYRFFRSLNGYHDFSPYYTSTENIDWSDMTIKPEFKGEDSDYFYIDLVGHNVYNMTSFDVELYSDSSYVSTDISDYFLSYGMSGVYGLTYHNNGNGVYRISGAFEGEGVPEEDVVIATLKFAKLPEIYSNVWFMTVNSKVYQGESYTYNTYDISGVLTEEETTVIPEETTTAPEEITTGAPVEEPTTEEPTTGAPTGDYPATLTVTKETEDTVEIELAVYNASKMETFDIEVNYDSSVLGFDDYILGEYLQKQIYYNKCVFVVNPNVSGKIKVGCAFVENFGTADDTIILTFIFDRLSDEATTVTVIGTLACSVTVGGINEEETTVIPPEETTVIPEETTTAPEEITTGAPVEEPTTEEPTTEEPTTRPEETTTSHRHSYSGEIIAVPSCTAIGKALYTCSCGDSYIVELSPEGHADNNGDGICDNCQYMEEDNKENDEEVKLSFFDKIKQFFLKIKDFFLNLFK